MMTQDYFEHPAKQYKQFGITAHPEHSRTIGDPADFVDDQPNEEQQAVIEAICDQIGADDAVTYDELSGLWISGREEDIEAMLDSRDEFLDALEANEHTEPA